MTSSSHPISRLRCCCSGSGMMTWGKRSFRSRTAGTTGVSYVGPEPRIQRHSLGRSLSSEASRWDSGCRRPAGRRSPSPALRTDQRQEHGWVEGERRGYKEAGGAETTTQKSGATTDTYYGSEDHSGSEASRHVALTVRARTDPSGPVGSRPRCFVMSAPRVSSPLAVIALRASRPSGWVDQSSTEGGRSTEMAVLAARF